MTTPKNSASKAKRRSGPTETASNNTNHKRVASLKRKANEESKNDDEPLLDPSHDEDFAELDSDDQQLATSKQGDAEEDTH